MQALAGIDGIELPRIGAGVDAVFLRFPLLLKGPIERDRTAAVLRREGLGASTMYPRAVTDIPEAGPHLASRRPCPQSEDVARRILALPTHPLVTANDREQIVRLLLDGACT